MDCDESTQNPTLMVLVIFPTFSSTLSSKLANTLQLEASVPSTRCSRGALSYFLTFSAAPFVENGRATISIYEDP